MKPTQQQKITALFDQHASSYDQQWSELAPINGALHLLAAGVLLTLPATAHVLCVGAGTGAEVLYLAKRFPGWRFTAVEPSAAMQEVLRRRADEHGIASRCVFHEGYLDSLPPGEPYDAATALLVSQFILDRGARSEFFEGIADRLRPAGLLLSSDLAGDLATPQCRSLLEVWFRLMKGAAGSPDQIERMREAYARDVAVLSPAHVASVIARGGFEPPVLFLQAGLIHAWYATRSPAETDAIPGA